MNNKPTQKSVILAMLREGPKTTAEFCSTPGLAAEYRRAISELRKDRHTITATRQREGRWEYRLEIE